MAGFVDQELKGPVDQSEEKTLGPSAIADQAQGLAIEGVDPFDAIDFPEMPVYDFKEKGFNTLPQMVDQGYQEDFSLERLQEYVDNSTQKQQVVLETQTYNPEQTYLIDGVEYTQSDMRYATNVQIAEQLFRDRINQIDDDTGVVGKVTDWVDRYVLRQIPIGMIEDLTRRSERKGAELMQAAITMNPEEYKTYIETYIEELSQEGFFKSENLFALYDGFNEATNAGYDKWATLNQVLAVADIGAIAAGGLKLSKAILRADSTIGRIAAIEGQEAAADAAESIIKQTAGTEAEVAAKAGPAIFDEGSAVVRPQSAKTVEIAEENALWGRIRELDSKGSFGRIVTPEKLKGVVDEVASAYAKRVSNITNNIEIVEDIAGNPLARIDFGKVKDGKPYKTESAATKVAKNSGIEEAYAAPVDPSDPKKGFTVRVDARIDTTGLADEFDPNDVQYGYIKDTFTRFFGSNASQDADYLNALANMGEAGLTAVKNISRDFDKALQSIPFESKQAITRVYKELRDGVDADVKDGYTTEEFKQKFKENHSLGKLPTKKDIEAYNSLVSFEDAGWLMRANEKLTKYVKNDYWALEAPNGNRLVGTKIKQLDEEVKVLNYASGRVETYDKIDLPIWRLDLPTEDGIEYVANPSKVSILDHSDVMGFNSGGRRVNPQANYFVSTAGDTPKAFLTSFSEKQAKQAVDDINVLRDALGGRNIDTVKSTKHLDELVQKHNDWNTNLESWDDFVAFIKERGIDLGQKISYKERGGQVIDETKNSLFHGDTWDQYVKTQLRRYNQPLMEYGGKESYNVDPVNAIMKEFANAATHYTHRSYTYTSSAAWVKKAASKGSGVRLSDDYAKNDYLNQVRHAEITGNSATARKLRQQRSIIMRRLKMKGPVQQAMENFGQEAREFIFNTSGVKLNTLDPSASLMTLGFQSAFGFFNISQFVMQGLHSATIAAISPQGFKGAAMAIPLRMAFEAPPAARKLWIKRAAGAFGESEQTMRELLEYLETSGRGIIDNDIIELGTGPSWGLSGWAGESMLPSAVRKPLGRATMAGKKLLDYGLTPFKAGERLSRFTAINTAFLEFKKKFPSVSPLSDEGRRWITNREQTLSFNMTAASRPLFQEGLMKLPTQWLSYSFRSLESIVVGRGLTKAERARLALVLGPMYGATGMGMGQVADYLTEAFGVDRPEFFVGLKYGIPDWLISELTPFDTALGARLAPITAFTDIWKKVVGGEATPLALALGPSGEITGGALTTVFGALQEVWQGNTVSLSNDVVEILRQPSGLDNISKAIGIMNNGLYRSKTGVVYPEEMKPVDALQALFGFSPLEVNEFYYRRNKAYTDDKNYRSFRKQMLKDFDRAIRTSNEDPDKSSALLREISTKIALSGLSESQKAEIRGSLRMSDNTQIYQLVKDLYERDKQATGKVVEQILRGNN